MATEEMYAVLCTVVSMVFTGDVGDAIDESTAFGWLPSHVREEALVLDNSKLSQQQRRQPSLPDPSAFPTVGWPFNPLNTNLCGVQPSYWASSGRFATRAASRGTGVFIPEAQTRKPAATAFLPARVVQALDLNSNDVDSQALARRHGVVCSLGNPTYLAKPGNASLAKNKRGKDASASGVKNMSANGKANPVKIVKGKDVSPSKHSVKPETGRSSQKVFHNCKA